MGEFDLLSPKGSKKNRKIKGRGRGSGKGGSCGRGHDGQNSRSGGKVRPGFEGGQMPLYRRIARRGFSNYPFKVSYEIVNVRTLDKKFSDGETVDKETLVARNVVKNNGLLVKILGNGDISKKLTVKIDKVSAGAREKLEKAGGTVEELITSDRDSAEEMDSHEKPQAKSTSKGKSESKVKEKEEAKAKKEKKPKAESETETKKESEKETELKEENKE
jgi:large subunit ribosomal protein L15